MEQVTDLKSLENFEELCEAFSADYRVDANTLHSYKVRFSKWQGFLHDQRGITIIEADAEDLSAYADFLTSQLAPKVKPQYLSALNTLYGFLIDKGLYAGENPYEAYHNSLSKYKQQKAKNEKRIEYRVPERDKFSDEEIELLLDNAPKIMRARYLRAVIDNAVNTGIRVDGLSKLTLEKFKYDDTTGVWYIQLTKGLIPEENDTKTHNYQVPVPASLVERNREYMEKRNADAEKRGKPIADEYKSHLFISQYSEPLSGCNISKKFTDFVWKLFPEEIQKRKLTIHSLRKSFGSRKLGEGFSLHEVSKMLGHTSIQTTIIYLKLHKEEVLASYAEKSKDQDLDFVTQLETSKQTRKIQKTQEEIIGDQERIYREILDVNTRLLNREGNQTQLRLRLEELIYEQQLLANQLVSPREQELLEEREMLLKRIQSLEEQLQYANTRMKELPNFKLYEKKTKKSLKQQMQDRAVELYAEGQGLGYGKIADAINEEFNTAFERHTIKYWLNKAKQTS